MSWALPYVTKLRAGETVQFRPKGNSMRPRIQSGQLVTVRPITDDDDVVGHPVLARIGRTFYVHYAGAEQGGLFRIQNARGHVNGWVPRDHIYGVVTGVAR